MVMGKQQRLGAGEVPDADASPYDVAADLQPGTRYDEVVRALAAMANS